MSNRRFSKIHPFGLFFLEAINLLVPWRRVVVVIVSATGPVNRGFESRQGARFRLIKTLQCCSL
jgi:hypothetical protein